MKIGESEFNDTPIPGTERARPKEIMGGFAKGLRVIEAFADSVDDKLSISNVARLSGLDRAVARRCILTLLHTGYINTDGKRYHLTPRILRLSNSFLAASLPRSLSPTLESVSEKIHESCSASVLDDTAIIYIARASQRRVMSVGLHIGSRLPAFCTSMGRVLLASLGEEKVIDVLKRSPLEPLTRKTRVDVDELLKEISKVRKKGFALVDQELEMGLRSISVPVYNVSGKVVAAINVGVHASRITSRQLTKKVLPVLLEAQSELSQVLP
jgi:IclR family pca regulon transcriptional regulator